MSKTTRITCDNDNCKESIDCTEREGKDNTLPLSNWTLFWIKVTSPVGVLHFCSEECLREFYREVPSDEGPEDQEDDKEIYEAYKQVNDLANRIRKETMSREEALENLGLTPAGRENLEVASTIADFKQLLHRLLLQAEAERPPSSTVNIIVPKKKEAAFKIWLFENIGGTTLSHMAYYGVPVQFTDQFEDTVYVKVTDQASPHPIYLHGISVKHLEP